jgi:Mrp family chromosome partitioning ATPase
MIRATTDAVVDDTLAPLDPVLHRQLHYVCGKGGVGKSVVACALARRFHGDGLRVLLVQVNAPDSHSRLLGTPPIGPELREERLEPPGGARGAGTLHVVNITPAAAMKEYALMTLRFEALYRTVFENRLTKVFLRFVPSMTELTIQGKIWHHAEEKDEAGRPRFDRIVVDSPSTGHGLRFLRVARIITDASRVGPMAEKTRLMAAVIEDEQRTALHVVALPEELPVNEARDLVGEIRRARTAPLGLAFLNQRLQRLFDAPAEAALAHVRARPVTDTALLQLLEVADRRRQRENLEREQRGRLEALAMPIVELPLLLVAPLGRDEVDRLAALLPRTSARPSLEEAR